MFLKVGVYLVTKNEGNFGSITTQEQRTKYLNNIKIKYKIFLDFPSIFVDSFFLKFVSILFCLRVRLIFFFNEIVGFN